MTSEQLIKQHEGLRLKRYMDTEGVLTIGYGHTGGKIPAEISLDEAELLFEQDMISVRTDLEKEPFGTIYNNLKSVLDEVRVAVMENMMFNLGYTRLSGFKKMINAMKWGDYITAASEMLNSKWATQVKGRATTLAEMMRTGEWRS